ncbi:MAG TPA: hydrogenase maturation protease [Euzebyales bacterium]|nr:hydrogenase maturation protease [Euzebyales bacterium]
MRDDAPGGAPRAVHDAHDGDRHVARTGVLVVGYGSDLRGDDAAGRHAAEAVGDRALPGVRVLSLPQLLPEVAVDLAGCHAVVFVDASVVDDAVRVQRLAPAAPDWRLTHHLTPPRLLALAAAVGRAPAHAFMVTVPAADVALGTALSPATAAALSDAVDRVVALCDEHTDHG